MVIPPGQEGCPGWRTEGSRVELIVKEPIGSQPLRRGHPHQPAIYARPAETYVIQEYEQNVGRTLRRLQYRREIGR